jgi:2'-hydroxyisoflavone reductase
MMNLLILGGTAFLGRHLVTLAHARGHTLTLFHRGQTNPGLFPEIESIHGDRTADLSPLAGRRWDAVIDTSGYHPRAVTATAQALSGMVDRYLFVSTISVYADFTQPHQDESAPVARLENPNEVELSNATYGPLKTHCEDVVLAEFGTRSLVVRPGLIIGPHDPTDRFTYWPVRARRGGEILAPQQADLPVQAIDARDLAEWMLNALEQGRDGIYNLTGPRLPYTLGALLADCIAAAQPQTPTTLTWVSPEFIAAHNLIPFQELPLWVPPTMPGLLTIDCTRAAAVGLHTRPLRASAADILAWHSPSAPLRAGLDAQREQELLAAWHGRTD